MISVIEVYPTNYEKNLYIGIPAVKFFYVSIFFDKVLFLKKNQHIKCQQPLTNLIENF